MAGSGKRASMREGPLADLFRKTEEEEGRPDRREPAPQPEPQPELPPRQEPPAPEPPSQRQEESSRQREMEERARERRDEARRESERRTHAARRIEERRHPQPQHRAAEPKPVRSRYEGVPTPEERLRSVFSPDIPENILERSPAPKPQRQPEADRYAGPAGTPGHTRAPVLRVVGVGGAGVNAVNRMIQAQVEGVEFVAVNTDLQSLEHCSAQVKVHIGGEATRGLGSGSNPDLGKAAAMEQYDELKGLLKGADMIFITAGAGGGTGTGAAPIVARISREVGALTVGIVTKPFGFEGARRSDQAERGVDELAQEVDTLIVIPNSRLLSVLDKKTSMVDAFRVADDVLRQGVQGISDLITLPGLINLDFADVRTIMAEAGQALLGIGMGVGDGRAMDAVVHAIESPLLETSLEGARSILLSITGGRDLSLWEVNEAAKAVAEAAHPDANIIFGAMVDEKVEDQVWVTVVATGYGDRSQIVATPRSDRIPADAEPRVRRSRPPGGAANGSLGEVDVPEFVPRR
jgi:cell division protein FtsZ